MKSRSVVFEAPDTIGIWELDVPEVGPGDMILKVEMTAICGTDPKLLADKYITHTFPLLPGHEVVGHVYKIGHAAAEDYGVTEGDRVTVEPQILCRKCRNCLTGNYHLCDHIRTYGVDISCNTPPHLWGGYGEYMFVAEGSKVLRVREDIPKEAACLSSVVGNGVRWIRTIGQVKFGESVVILGPGAQGLCSVIAANEAGANPIIIVGLPNDARRLALAMKFGATHALEPSPELPDKVREICGGRLADVVVECSGSPKSVAAGVDLLKPLGRFVIAGLTGPGMTGIEIDKIVVNELKLLGGCGQSWDVELAVDIINGRKYRIEDMITHTFPVLEAEEAIRFFAGGSPDCVKVGLVA